MREMSCLRGFIVSLSCMVLLVVQSSHGSQIIGGKEVKPHSLPFMALLTSKTHACGGILINPKWVLTAAHCDDKSPIKTVYLGVHSIKNEEKDPIQVRKVQKHVRHPDYVSAFKGNDLMLLKLDKPAKPTKTVKCLRLGKTIKEPAAGTSCLVAGWGKTSNSAKKMSDVLMSVNVNVIDRDTCNSPEYYGQKPVITSTMICAGSDRTTDAGSCGGDSGGPLLCSGALVGVTSFGGDECGVKTKPGVYSFLSKEQLNWIKKTVKKSEMYCKWAGTE